MKLFLLLDGHYIAVDSIVSFGQCGNRPDQRYVEDVNSRNGEQGLRFTEATVDQIVSAIRRANEWDIGNPIVFEVRP